MADSGFVYTRKEKVAHWLGHSLAEPTSSANPSLIEPGSHKTPRKPAVKETSEPHTDVDIGSPPCTATTELVFASHTSKDYTSSSSKKKDKKKLEKSKKHVKMATELTVQSERAYQKQPHIFQNGKGKQVKKLRAGKKGRRWYKDVGLGFRTPKAAIEGTYIDKKCPFTGEVSIRGRILTGTVISTKMHRTIIIRREYVHFVPKYGRYEKRHNNLAAHVSPCFRVEEGDQVTVGQCRPLSKTVRFNVLKINKKKGDGRVKGFVKF